MSYFKAKKCNARAAYSAPPYNLAIFKGPTTKGRVERGGVGKGKEGKKQKRKKVREILLWPMCKSMDSDGQSYVLV